MLTDYGTIWVCEDCYFAHHYGITIVAVNEIGYELPIHWYEMPTVLFAGDATGGFRFFAGETDSPCDRLPLGRIDAELHVADNTCSNHYYGQDPQPTDEHDVYDVPCEHCGQNGDENGIDEFSWRSCDGCGSTLGGARYRLALFTEE